MIDIDYAHDFDIAYSIADINIDVKRIIIITRIELNIICSMQNVVAEINM